MMQRGWLMVGLHQWLAGSKELRNGSTPSIAPSMSECQGSFGGPFLRLAAEVSIGSCPMLQSVRKGLRMSSVSPVGAPNRLTSAEYPNPGYTASAASNRRRHP